MFFIFLIKLSFAFHLPELRDYIPEVDTGYEQYQAKSLFGSYKVALTFDDGPHIVRTEKILNTLKKHNIKATFFVVSERINNQTKPLIQRMLQEGHIIGIHGHKHFQSNTISEKKFKDNLITSIKILRPQLEQSHLFYYRFPYAAYGRHSAYHHLNSLRQLSYQLFNDNCIHFTFWDHDSGDWIPQMTSKLLVTNTLASLEGGQGFSYQINNAKIEMVEKSFDPTRGGVLLFHDIQRKTVNAIEPIIEKLKQLNYDFVRLDQVEEYRPNYACKLSKYSSI